MWLKIQPDQRGLLKLTWGGEQGYLLHYYISEQFFAASARNAQDRLAEIGQAGRDGESVDPALVRALAVSGAQLWWSIFDVAGDGDGHRPAAGRIAALKKYIEERWHAGDKALTIATDPTLHAPWSVVYPCEEEAVPALKVGVKLEDSLGIYKDFWCLRYDLVATLAAMDPLGLSMARNRSQFRVLSFVHEEALKVGLAALEADEQVELERLVDLPEGRMPNLPAARQRSDKLCSKQLLLHFFGHHYAGQLDAGHTIFSITDLRRLLSSLSGDDAATDRPQRLVFVNACSGLVGSGYDNLRTVVAEPGYCGLVSTEADVPTPFAARFGLRLLLALASRGQSIGVAMKSLREDPKLWPLSLLYGCYADRSFQVAPEVAA
jgi:hypothetical protein